MSNPKIALFPFSGERKRITVLYVGMPASSPDVQPDRRVVRRYACAAWCPTVPTARPPGSMRYELNSVHTK